MTSKQEQAIADLCSRNLALKQIARQLGLRPVEVSAFLKTRAEEATVARVAAGELNPVFQCLVNKNCLDVLISPLLNTTTNDAIDNAETNLVNQGNLVN
ncbi:hypothetical protein OsccyDRAFT_2439 [Leptolyngbyaceae cyanobacterium JSC-12]|nr:hypothetical protein OsccyDRAFT_2439 [Leptolyngbyaceae cyanobacterium JSC-12]